MKFRTLMAASLLGLTLPVAGFAQSKTETLIVAGPRTPESADLDYPATEAVHEARRNIYERLLAYEMVPNKDGIMVENFGKLVGGLAESWEVAPDNKSITFHLRPAKAANGDVFSADDLMWTFDRGWHLKETFYWYVTQMLKIKDFDQGFQKIDEHTVRVSVPNPSPLIARLWVNNDLGIIDSTEAKKHVTKDDPWAAHWLGTHTASFAPYEITTFTPGQQVIYSANENYYRGAPKLKRIIFREMPTSSNRVAALQAGAVDVAEWLLPRELALLQNAPGVTIYKVFGNYIHRVEMNNSAPPFNDVRVRQAINYLVPRDAIAKSVYYGTARPTESPVSEIYPGFVDTKFPYTHDVAKAKALLTAAGFPSGFKTELGYRTGDEIEEQIAVILKTSLAEAGIDVQLEKMPGSSLVEKYTKAELPMYFLRDMAIVPDAAYVVNLWLNSASMVDYSRFKDPEVDKLINAALTSTDEPARLDEMRRAQGIVIEEAPWVFLFNPGYQLATRSTVKGMSWYTPNGNSWYDFSKQ